MSVGELAACPVFLLGSTFMVAWILVLERKKGGGEKEQKRKEKRIQEGLKSAMRLPLSLSSMLGSELGLSRLLPPSPLVELCTLNAL